MRVDLGAVLVDTDAIARELTAPGGAAIPALREAFGPQAVGADGALNRDWMRERVFSDPEAKGRLEAILHPMIGETAQQRALAAAPATVVFDVPLLVESGRWRSRVDRVLVVDCREQTQVERVMARNGWPAETVQRIIAQQATRAQRRAVADAAASHLVLAARHGPDPSARATRRPDVRGAAAGGGRGIADRALLSPVPCGASGVARGGARG